MHRLTFQRVWLLPPQDESALVENICWRPDGKLLAVTYRESKILYLIDVENKNIVHKTNLLSKNSPITCMAWLPLNLKGHNSNNDNNQSPTGNYLPTLPSLDRSFGQEPEKKEFLLQKLDMFFVSCRKKIFFQLEKKFLLFFFFNFLYFLFQKLISRKNLYEINCRILKIQTGQETGEIGMYIFGMFYCGTLSVGKGPILEISGGSGKPLWASWKGNNGIIVNKLSCTLLESSDAFLKVRFSFLFK